MNPEPRPMPAVSEYAQIFKNKTDIILSIYSSLPQQPESTNHKNTEIRVLLFYQDLNWLMIVFLKNCRTSNRSIQISPCILCRPNICNSCIFSSFPHYPMAQNWQTRTECVFVVPHLCVGQWDNLSLTGASEINWIKLWGSTTASPASPSRIWKGAALYAAIIIQKRCTSQPKISGTPPGIHAFHYHMETLLFIVRPPYSSPLPPPPISPL